MAGVSTLFLPANSLPKTETKDFIGGLEICRAMGSVVGHDKVDGSIRISGLWRLQVKDEKSRSLLLRMGLPIRGLNCTVLSRNPYHIGDEESVKLIVGNLPFSISENEIKQSLSSIGVQIGSSLQWEHYREEKDPENPDKIQGLTSFKTGRRFAYISKPTAPLPQRLKVANKFNAFLYYKGQKEALEAADTAAAIAAARAKSYLESQSHGPSDNVIVDDRSTAETAASQNHEPTCTRDPADAAAEQAAWDAVLAEVRARGQNDDNPRVDGESIVSVENSLSGDIVEDVEPFVNVSSSSPIASHASVSDSQLERQCEMVTGDMPQDTFAEILSDITKPRGDMETKKGASILDSVLRFSWGGRRSRSTQKSSTRRDKSRSTSRHSQGRKAKERHVAVKKTPSRDGADRVGPLDTFLNANKNTDFNFPSTSINQNAEVVEPPT